MNVSGLCMNKSPALSNFIHWYNFQSMTFPTQPSQLLYSFWSSSQTKEKKTYNSTKREKLNLNQQQRKNTPNDLIVDLVVLVAPRDKTKWLEENEETWSIIIEVQTDAIRTNYIKAKIDKTQQNSKCRLCEETVDYIVNDCSKLVTKEYKTRHDWMGKLIHRELCKKWKFDNTQHKASIGYVKTEMKQLIT